MISLLNLLSLLYYSMQTKFYETRPSEANDVAFNDSFIFHFLAIFFISSLSSPHLPLVPPSSSFKMRHSEK